MIAGEALASAASWRFNGGLRSRLAEAAEELGGVRLPREHEDVDGDGVAGAGRAGFAARVEEDAHLGLGEVLALLDGRRRGPGGGCHGALAPVGEVAADA